MIHMISTYVCMAYIVVVVVVIVVVVVVVVVAGKLDSSDFDCEY